MFAYASRGVTSQVLSAKGDWYADSCTARQILENLGSLEGWTHEEIRQDVELLDDMKLRTVQDLRDLNLKDWSNINIQSKLKKALLNAIV